MITVTVGVDSFDIAEALDRKQAFELIKLIDERQADYEFTEDVALFLLEEAFKCLEGEEVNDLKQAIQDIFSKY